MLDLSPNTLSVASLRTVDTTTAAFTKYSEKHSTTLLSKPVTSEMVRELLELIPELMDTIGSDTMSILSFCLSRIVPPSLQPMVGARGELKTMQMKVTLSPAATTWEVGSMKNSGITAREEVNFKSKHVCLPLSRSVIKPLTLVLPFSILNSLIGFFPCQLSVNKSYQDVYNYTATSRLVQTYLNVIIICSCGFIFQNGILMNQPIAISRVKNNFLQVVGQTATKSTTSVATHLSQVAMHVRTISHRCPSSHAGFIP